MNRIVLHSLILSNRKIFMSIFAKTRTNRTVPLLCLFPSMIRLGMSLIRCRFNETNWGGLFQAGFLKGEIGPKEVVYDMAYPLPLFNGQTKYTDSKGEKASVKFATSWFSKYGLRNTLVILCLTLLSIKKLHWEMLIHFAKGMPQLGEIKD